MRNQLSGERLGLGLEQRSLGRIFFVVHGCTMTSVAAIAPVFAHRRACQNGPGFGMGLHLYADGNVKTKWAEVGLHERFLFGLA